MIGTPIGAVLVAGIGAVIGGGIGLFGGVVGGGAAGVGIAQRNRQILIKCTAEDIFKHLEQQSNYRRDGNLVLAEITGTFTCPGTQRRIIIGATN